VYWNEPSTTLFGIAAGDAATRVITDIMPDPADVEEPTLVRLRGGGTFHGEIAVRRPDGTSVVALISDSPIRDDAGQTMGLVRVATDVTARKQVERAQQLLADAGAALSASMDYETTIRDVTRLSIRGFADCCVAILVDEGGETWQLEAACVDAAMEEVARDPAWVYRAEAGEAHPIADVMSTGRVQFMPSIDVDALPVDAAWTHWMRRFGFRSAIIAPLVAGGDAVGAIAFYRAPGGTPYDANDLRLAEDLAIRAATAIQQSRLFESALIANRAKSDFLAVMSHELRTPLTTITGYTDLLFPSRCRSGTPDM
jgi:PAS domain S-box-containing protein